MKMFYQISIHFLKAAKLRFFNQKLILKDLLLMKNHVL